MKHPNIAVVELLSVAIATDGPGLRSDLDALSGALAAAVSSYLGFTIHTEGLAVSWGPHLPSRNGQPIRAGSTLRWSLNPTATPEAAVTLVLFAANLGAWVDLSADLAWLTQCPPQHLTLDGDLSATVSLDHTDLIEASIINQAIGALIGQGHPPGQANNELDARARASNTDCTGAAQTLLDNLTPEPTPT